MRTAAAFLLLLTSAAAGAAADGCPSGAGTCAEQEVAMDVSLLQQHAHPKVHHGRPHFERPFPGELDRLREEVSDGFKNLDKKWSHPKIHPKMTEAAELENDRTTDARIDHRARVKHHKAQEKLREHHKAQKEIPEKLREHHKAQEELRERHKAQKEGLEKLREHHKAQEELHERHKAQKEGLEEVREHQEGFQPEQAEELHREAQNAFPKAYQHRRESTLGGKPREPPLAAEELPSIPKEPKAVESAASAAEDREKEVKETGDKAEAKQGQVSASLEKFACGHVFPSLIESSCHRMCRGKCLVPVECRTASPITRFPSKQECIASSNCPDAEGACQKGEGMMCQC